MGTGAGDHWRCRLGRTILLLLLEHEMKTNELTGPALDAKVAKCMGIEVYEQIGYGDDGGLLYFRETPTGQDILFRPSTDWDCGGPIIERERICLIPPHADIEMWEAYHPDFPQAEHYGPTLLIAAMRCYVAAVLGDEVEVPDGL